jgi:asparagine synthase (glutamine-hydrolysing)
MERFAGIWRYLPSPLRAALAAAFALAFPANDQNRKLATLGRANGRVPHPYFLARMLFTPAPQDALCASRDEEAIKRAAVPLEESLRHARNLDAINRVSFLEARCYMLNTLLRDADVMSMAHGLEVRVPLIDHLLAEKLMAVPGVWKVSGRGPKPLLVEALGGALPDDIVRRRKRGFTLPFEHWLRDELRSEVDQTLQRSADGPLAALLNPTAVQAIWHDFGRGRTSWSRPWALYVLQRWCELHAVTN